MSACKRCRQKIEWGRLPSGRLVALDAHRLEPDVGLLAFNPTRRTSIELAAEHVPHPAWQWAYAGATFHERHLDVCPGSPTPQRRARHRAGQERLALS